jgi:hypothetical protein
MSPSVASTQPQSASLQQLQLETEALKKYLAAQKVVIASLERRVGRSLDTLDVHLQSLISTSEESALWYEHLHFYAKRGQQSV